MLKEFFRQKRAGIILTIILATVNVIGIGWAVLIIMRCGEGWGAVCPSSAQNVFIWLMVTLNWPLVAPILLWNKLLNTGITVPQFIKLFLWVTITLAGVFYYYCVTGIIVAGAKKYWK